MGGGTTTTTPSAKPNNKNIHKQTERYRQACRDIREAAAVAAAIGTLTGQPEIIAGAALVGLSTYALEGAALGLDYALTGE